MSSLPKKSYPSLTQLRRLAKRLPESTELETWGHPTFRVRDKIYASFDVDENGCAHISCKQTRADQAALVKDSRFAIAKYVGRYGWISLQADEVKWPMIEDLVVRSYRLIAPKTLASQA